MSGFSFLPIEHFGNPGNYGKFSEAHFSRCSDYLSHFKHFPRHFVCSRQNSQSFAQDHQKELTIEAWEWLFLILKPKWYLDIKLEAFYQFSSNGNCKQWVLFYLKSFVLIPGISGFSFFATEHIRKPGNHGQFSEAYFSRC